MPGKPVVIRDERERKLNFWERIYLPEVLRGLGYSLRQMAPSRQYTFSYPEAQWTPPDIFRGRPVLVEEDGRPRCVSCNLCARACPPMAISMQSKEMDDPSNPKEREPAWFEINMLRCIYCGYCEEVCPEEAIVMSKEYDLTFQNREEAIMGLDKLLIPKERLEDRLNFLAAAKNPQWSEADWSHRQDNNLHSLKDRHFIRYLIDEGLEELKRTHLRDDDRDMKSNLTWGAERHGPPAVPYVDGAK